MKLKYFGTAAYEGFPAIGCTCDACRRAWAAGGKNMRMRTQALVDETLLLDFPADTMHFFMKYRVNYEKIKACLVSHAHSDHLYVGDVEALGNGYTHNERKEPLHFFVGETGYQSLAPKVELEHVKPRVDATMVSPLDRFLIDDYQILAVRATHDPNSSPLTYRIEKGGKAMYFAHDTGTLCEESLQALESAGRLDCISLDCNNGFLPERRKRHLGLDTALEQLEELDKRGIIDKNTVKILNHFSHNGKATYDDIAPRAERYGLLVSYDGMEVEF